MQTTGLSHPAEFAVPLLIVFMTVCTVLGMMGLVHLLTRIVGRIRLDARKASTYECGEEPVGSAWTSYNARFHRIALVFLLFGVELALLYPVLLRFPDALARGVGWRLLLEVFVFTGTVALGLAYAARRGDLDWVRPLSSSSRKTP